MAAALDLSREQILAHRLTANALHARLPPAPASLRLAGWAGFQDSMPRAALLSIHARVKGTHAATLDDPALVQLWGPRFSVYVVAAPDLGVFSLGRLPTDEKGLRRAEELADLLETRLAGRRIAYAEAGAELGVHANRLRYAAPTGRLVLRWEGARAPVVWTVPPPEIDAAEARLELARRYLHVFGPTTPAAYARWAGIDGRTARTVFASLTESLVPVQTPIGDGWILASDEGGFRAPTGSAEGARFLPSGDAYFLLHGADRELLVPEPARRNALWTPRVWPGALLLRGELVGTWRRDGADLTIQQWRRLSPGERAVVEDEARSLPLPGLAGDPRLRW